MSVTYVLFSVTNLKISITSNTFKLIKIPEFNSVLTIIFKHKCFAFYNFTMLYHL